MIRTRNWNSINFVKEGKRDKQQIEEELNSIKEYSKFGQNVLKRWLPSFSSACCVKDTFFRSNASSQSNRDGSVFRKQWNLHDIYLTTSSHRKILPDWRWFRFRQSTLIVHNNTKRNSILVGSIDCEKLRHKPYADWMQRKMISFLFSHLKTTSYSYFIHRNFTETIP